MTHHKLHRYGYTVHIVIADSDCEFGKLQTKRDNEWGERHDKKAGAITYMDRGMVYILFRPSITINDIAHEVYHAVRYMKYKNEERAAYMSGDLVELICKLKDNRASAACGK